MGVTRNEIFGDATGAEPATPGSYGQPPSGHRLPEEIHLGPVHLQIADLDRSVAYYEQTLGTRVLEQGNDHVVLSARDDEVPLIELHERVGAHPAHRGQLGLYHFAILLPDRPSLGRYLRYLSEIGTPVGTADHLVSESIYLRDPDNLGIEVYADQPRSTWRRLGRELMMASDPLDATGLVREASSAPWSGLPQSTVMGHLHLHVGDLTAASAFYSEGLGFDRTVWEYPGALFLAARNYHHHLGTNIWAGPGAQPPSAQDAQLLEWTVDLPHQTDLDAAARSLEHSGAAIEWQDSRGSRTFATQDPWGTRVRLRSIG
jgi:catechol 2,3-dioxygenase